jgi:FkbM family methyltransferase
VVSLHLATVALFPIGIAARKVGRPLPDPRRFLGEYVVIGPAGAFACPPSISPFFLGVDSSYEPGLCGVVDQIDGGVFVDVGASIGFITVRAARRAQRVIAVEPHPVRFDYLRRNVALNQLTNVTCIHCALGSEEGVVTLFDIEPTLGPHPLDVSTTPGRGERYEVPVRRLDDLVDDDVRVVKIDVEGDELNVLDGAVHLLEKKPTLVVECLTEERANGLRERLPHYTFEEIDPHNQLGTATL